MKLVRMHKGPDGTPPRRPTVVRWALRAMDFGGTLLYSVAGRVFLITLAVLVVTSYLLINVELRETTDHGFVRPWVDLSAEVVQRTLEMTMLEEGPHHVPREFARLLQRSNRISRIDVTDVDLKVRFSDDPAMVGSTVQGLRREEMDDLEADGSSRELPGRPGFRLATRPMVVRTACRTCHTEPTGTLLGHLVVTIDAGGVASLIQETGRGVLRIMTGVVLLLAIGLGTYVHRSLVEPSRRVARHMTRLGEGTDLVPLDTASLPGDLRGIAEGYNDGVARLERARKAVARLQKERMEHIERLATLGQLSASMAHEIRNPVAGIEGAARALGEDLELDDEHRRIVEEIRHQSQRLSRTLSEFLASARPGECAPSSLSPHQIVDRAMHLLAPSMARHGIRMTASVRPGTPAAVADEECIVRILMNLLLNAQQALETPGGSVVVVVGRSIREGFVDISVTDDGPGIPPEVLVRVGEPFFTTKPAGTGLGLAISREMAERMGGSLDIRSVVGEGTRVTLSLPESQAPVPPEEDA